MRKRRGLEEYKEDGVGQKEIYMGGGFMGKKRQGKDVKDGIKNMSFSLPTL